MKKRISRNTKIIFGIILLLLCSLVFWGLSLKNVDYKESLAVEKEVLPVNPEAPAADATEQEEEGSLDFNKSYVINILFLGIDVTQEFNDPEALHRADTISLIRIDLDTKNLKFLSIPRDTYTYVPIENKKDKINHAYAYGSIKGKAAESTIEAVNSFLKYDTVDYYFTFDLEPVPKIVDAIGGVELDVEVDMLDHDANLSKGFQVLDGQKAYDYIHWRYSGDGDIGRIKRQQKFLGAVYNKLKLNGKLSDTIKLVMDYKDNMKTDMTIKQIIGLAKFAGEVSSENMDYYIIQGYGKTIDKISYYIPDESETDILLKNFFSLK